VTAATSTADKKRIVLRLGAFVHVMRVSSPSRDRRCRRVQWERASGALENWKVQRGIDAGPHTALADLDEDPKVRECSADHQGLLWQEEAASIPEPLLLPIRNPAVLRHRRSCRIPASDSVKGRSVLRGKLNPMNYSSSPR